MATIKGNQFNNKLYGTGGSDNMSGGDGDDTIRGGGGHDYVYGDNGNDVLYGESGNDFILGGFGNDTVYGGTGNDTLLGGSGNDLLDGGANDDELDGGTGNDTLIGGTGNDILTDVFGDNILNGGAGNDMLRGGGGNNTYLGGSGDDIIFANRDPIDGVFTKVNGGTGMNFIHVQVETEIDVSLGQNTLVLGHEVSMLSGTINTTGYNPAEDVIDLRDLQGLTMSDLSSPWQGAMQVVRPDATFVFDGLGDSFSIQAGVSNNLIMMPPDNSPPVG